MRVRVDTSTVSRETLLTWVREWAPSLRIQHVIHEETGKPQYAGHFTLWGEEYEIVADGELELARALHAKVMELLGYELQTEASVDVSDVAMQIAQLRRSGQKEAADALVMHLVEGAPPRAAKMVRAGWDR